MKTSRVKIYLKLKYIFKSFFSNFKNSKINVEKNLTETTKKKYVEFFGMCRTSFLVILEYLKIKNPNKDELIICSYNLEEMIDIARLYNFKIKLTDINFDNGVMNFDQIKSFTSKRTAAILFTNMFNNYTELRKIRKFCNDNDILMIEDNAIYYGNYSKQETNKEFSGSYGDVSIFSFGIMKNVSAIFGGALLTSNIDIYNFANKKKGEFKKFPNELYISKFILYFILKFFLSKFVYNIFFFHIIRISHDKNIKNLLHFIYPSLKFKPKIKVPEEYYCKISKFSIKLIDQTIKDHEFEQERIKRKENNKLYSELLGGNTYIKIFDIENFNFQNFLDFPILIKNNKENLVKYLFKKGLETRYHFYSNYEKYTQNNLNKVSEFYDKNILCLPSHSEISKQKIRMYCEEINQFYLNDQSTDN